MYTFPTTLPPYLPARIHNISARIYDIAGLRATAQVAVVQVPFWIVDALSTSNISQNLQHSWPSRDRTSGSRTSARLDYFDSYITSTI